MSKDINTVDLKHLCTLSMLDANSMNASQIQTDISNIIQYLKRLDNVDTDQIKPLSHPLEVMQPLRSDQVTASDRREQLQKLSTDTQDGLYLVPTFIES